MYTKQVQCITRYPDSCIKTQNKNILVLKYKSSAQRSHRLLFRHCHKDTKYEYFSPNESPNNKQHILNKKYYLIHWRENHW